MIELIVFLGALAGTLVFTTWRTSNRRKRVGRTWRTVGFDLGLDVTLDRTAHHCELNGTLNNARLKASVEAVNSPLATIQGLLSFRQDSSVLRTVISAQPASGPPIPPIRIQATSVLAAWQTGAVLTGDPDFDRNFVLDGDRSMLLALLGTETRDRLARVLARGVEVSDMRVHYSEAGLEDEAGPLRSVIKELAWAATALQLDLSQIPARIAANFRSETHPDVRLRQLEVLVRQFSGRESTQALLQHAMSDPDPDVVMLAAEFVGASGRPRLRALAMDPAKPLAARERALAAYVERAPPSDAHALLDTLFEAPVDGLAIGIAKAIIRTEHQDAVWWLRATLPRAPAIETRVALFDAAGALQVAAFEGPLLDSLEHSDFRIRRAALRALAKVGTLGSVQRLMPLTEGLVSDTEIKTLARRAIQQIQSREAGGAQAGQLAVVDEGGQLALADQRRAGRLTVTEGEP